MRLGVHAVMVRLTREEGNLVAGRRLTMRLGGNAVMVRLTRDE